MNSTPLKNTFLESEAHPSVQQQQLLASLLASSVSESSKQGFIHCSKLALIELANLNFLNFALYRSLERNQLTQHFTEDERAYLKDLFELNKQRNLAFVQELNTILEELNKLDMAPVLLKGAVALLDGWYEDIGERFLRDVDILLPEDEAQQAFDHLQSLGYELVNPLDEKLHELKTHQLAALHKKDSALVIEIHTAPITLKAKGLLTAEQVFSQKRVPDPDKLAKLGIAETESPRFYLPSEQHCLLIALVHTEIADNNREQCRFFLRHGMDIERILKRYGLEYVNELAGVLKEAGYNNLLEDYFQSLDFFFTTDFLKEINLANSTTNSVHLNAILDKLIKEQQNSNKQSKENRKLAYLWQQSLYAFSREKISMRYGVNAEPAMSYYRVVNMLRLLKKYFVAGNREKLNKTLDESLQTKKMLDKK